MTDETVQPEVAQPTPEVVSEVAAPTEVDENKGEVLAEAIPAAPEHEESFFQRVEKALEELAGSPAALFDWVRQEVAKVRS